MKDGPHVWMAAAEAAPLVQVGGLGDVLRALPSALQRAGARVRRFLPAYASVATDGFRPEGPPLRVPFDGGTVEVRFLTRLESDGVATTLVSGEALSGEGGIYGGRGSDFPEAPRRFTIFSRAVAERARAATRPPDILHAHDWHAALVPLFVRLTDPWLRLPRTVMTIHNMGYLGRYPMEVARWLALPGDVTARLMSLEGIEFHGDVALLKAGLVYADACTAVSPTYAREITTPQMGFGLDGLMRHRATALHGILNGGDYEIWNPDTDPHLPAGFGPGRLLGKARARDVLRQRLGMASGRGPVIAALGRLVHQKGTDMLIEAAPRLIESASLAVVGSGDRHLEKGLESLRARHPDRVGLHLGYSDPLAHLLLAGADVCLVPSRYEPCGLVQMHAMRYGTVPVVQPTGGLADTVVDESGAPGRGTGFHMPELSPRGLEVAVERALRMRETEPEAWSGLQARAMRADFSWDRAAAEYLALYRRLLA